MRLAGLLAALLGAMASATRAQPPPYAGVPYIVVQDGIPQPVGAAPGDPARGRAIVANRSVGLCLLCHSGPIPEERFQGNLAPSLAGAGGRWSVAQLRLRIVDGARLNPDTIMPPYYRTTGLQR